MKFEKTQLAKLLLLLFLLLITPFISASIRTSYVYFVLNILIVALGVEAGLLTALLGPSEEKIKPIKIITPIAAEAVPRDEANAIKPIDNVPHAVQITEKPVIQQQKKDLGVARVHKKVIKRCYSKPSLFFIGGGEGEAYDQVEEREEKKVVEVAGELSGQELFAKAETFIGNFYKQLKMQREESWKKIHGLVF